ncbi:carboxymuconolactone decarboxylase family protein [Salinibius halmophilus]|uniref:carboxymuconolactone decarboxylase family protein n=1 Tax=Salinibius halmophilus TaxID=1853216 RepID=UPI000E674B9D|nr:carboxymuconolactone decarboxylase family protein [Salinibius halmophilus]
MSATNISFDQIPAPVIECMMFTERKVNQHPTLDYKLLELVRLYVAHLNQCAYCVDMHVKEARAAGESDVRLNLVPLWQETNLFSSKEQAIFAWTEAVTHVADTGLAEFKSRFEQLSEHLSRDEIAELNLAINQINSWTRIAKPFGFEAGGYVVQS